MGKFKKILHWVFNNELRRNHPIYYFVLLFTFFITAVGFVYAIINKQYSLEEIIQFLTILVYLAVIISTAILFIGTIINISRIYFYGKQERNYRFEKTKAELQIKKLLNHQKASK